MNVSFDVKVVDIEVKEKFSKRIRLHKRMS